MKELHAELMEEQQQLLNKLQQQLEATHQEEMQHTWLQSQTLHNIDLETLQLNLNNTNTTQLEQTQTNLRKEREPDLMELQEMLYDTHAWEAAVPKNQHQFELEHIKEQNLKEKEEIALKYQQELELKEQRLVPTSYLEDVERLKQDFEQQQQQRSNHETELELRTYVEQKLRTVEENYRGEFTVLHQRLQEVDSLELDISHKQPVNIG
uniref:Uncharacterized protein n=1 Tax=Sphenodon punctatus TaxID=8508 RepID=A0A8D0H896_SPHPU